MTMVLQTWQQMLVISHIFTCATRASTMYRKATVVSI
jgi:hypothetical protein